MTANEICDNLGLSGERDMKEKKEIDEIMNPR